MFSRAGPGMQRATLEAAGSVCVLCTHANTIRSLITGGLGLSSPEGYEFAIDPAHAHLLVDAEEAWELREQNLAPGTGA